VELLVAEEIWLEIPVVKQLLEVIGAEVAVGGEPISILIQHLRLRQFPATGGNHILWHIVSVSIFLSLLSEFSSFTKPLK